MAALFQPAEPVAMRKESARAAPSVKEGENMEGLDAVLQAISTTGFPIVVCLILMWYVNKQLDTHKEETNALKDVIAENTAMLQKLTVMIEGKYKVE